MREEDHSGSWAGLGLVERLLVPVAFLEVLLGSVPCPWVPQDLAIQEEMSLLNNQFLPSFGIRKLRFKPNLAV